jgi:hypothetical protein
MYCQETQQPVQVTGFFVCAVFAAIANAENSLKTISSENKEASKIVRAFLFAGTVDFTKPKY